MRIAIIGMIGSGKSEALDAAREMGLATLSADDINRELLASEGYIALLGREFPFAVRDGKVDRVALAKAVFGDDEARARLNAIAHPRILARIAADKSDPLVVETPLYHGTGAEALFDRTLLIVCPSETRAERLIKRGMTAEDIEARLSAQRGYAEQADAVIVNDGSIEQLRERTKLALSAFLSNAIEKQDIK